MATNQEAPSLEETLEKTDLGHVINENKKMIMIIGGVLVAAILAYSVSESMNTKNHYAKLDRVFTVEQTVFDVYLGKKGEAKVFIQALAGINNELIAEPNLIPPFLEALNKLSEAGLVDQSVLTIGQTWLDRISKSNFLHTLLAIRLAALNEDANKLDQSVKLLEGLVGKKSMLLKDKIHFELGRLYLAKGDEATAKERFDYIFKNHENSDFATLAKVYLSGI